MGCVTLALAAEAKWTSDRVDLGGLRTLQRRVAADRQLALFARSGFTPDVEAACDPDLLFFSLDDLLL